MSTMLFLEIVMANILISRKKTMVKQIHKFCILTIPSTLKPRIVEGTRIQSAPSTLKP